MIGERPDDQNTSKSEKGLNQAVVKKALQVLARDQGGISISDQESPNKVSLITRGVDYQPSQVRCSPGSVPVTHLESNQSCVKCPPGTFYNDKGTAAVCQHCPSGSYQPYFGQTSCLPCPKGTDTKSLEGGARSHRQCKGLCRPGTYSSDGLEPCITCKIGFFETNHGSISCKPCPHGFETLHRGSTSSTDCQEICPAGQVSESRLAPCFQCPSGTFQDIPGQQHCIQCPFRHDSSTFSTRKGLNSVYDCPNIFEHPWSTENTSHLPVVPINECFASPCINGATCYPQDFGFTCKCPPGYTGSLCEVELNYCLSSPCLNGGQCLPGTSLTTGQPYTCQCPMGFHGEYCEFDEDECAMAPCFNGGTCINEFASFTCVCTEGFEGQMCELHVDDCITNGCQNGGTCIDGYKNYTCFCAPGFSGQYCEQDIDECLSFPCQNGGTCVDVTDSYQCICPQGYEGDQCQFEIDECILFQQQVEFNDPSSNFATDACLNGGTCVDRVGGFECACAPGFAGNWCERELPSEYVLEFGSHDLAATGTSDYVLLTNRPIPDMTELTFCFWMMTSDMLNYGTPVSYATDTEDNEVTFTDYNGFVLAIKGQKVITDITANDGTWTFLCTVWSSQNGSWAVYQDGAIADHGLNLARNETIDGKGVLILGQEQDSPGSKFSASEAFRGKLTRFNLWNRTLSQDEILNVMNDCSEKTGNVAAWADFYNGVHGLIQRIVLNPCQGCPPLEAPIHGFVTISNQLDESLRPDRHSTRRNSHSSHMVATYTCGEGYMLSAEDEAIRECGVLGDWRGAAPNCRLVNCGFPGYLPNGYVHGQSYFYGDFVSYDCKSGFVLVGGNRTQRCLMNGTWSGLKPRCQELTCKIEDPFFNGQVINQKNEYKVGEIIELTCNRPDLYLDGPSQLTCLDDGSWSDILPTCKGPPCPRIPSIDHGEVLVVDQDHLTEVSPDEDSYSTNTVVTYGCKDGYRLIVSGVDRLFCHPNGVWSGHPLQQTTKILPQCVKVECSVPSLFQNGFFTLQSDDFNGTAELTCHEGFHIFTPSSYSSTISSSAIFKCSKKETWVMVTGYRSEIELSSVKCRPMRCPFPEEISRGAVEFSGLTVGSMARYACTKSYRLLGRGQRRCLSTGKWSHKPPRCI